MSELYKIDLFLFHISLFYNVKCILNNLKIESFIKTEIINNYMFQ